MNLFKNFARKALVACLSAIVVAAPFTAFLNSDDVKAASAELTSIASIEVSQVKTDDSHGAVDLLANPDTPITYGDTIVFKLSWEIPDGLVFSTDDVFTYQIVGDIVFDKASGKLTDGNKNLGTYKIEGKTITIQYTDENFCNNDDKRVGHLKFDGRIKDDGNGAQPDKVYVIQFPAIEKKVTLHMVPPPTDSKVSVTKKFTAADESKHIYDCVIGVTSTGANTNVLLDDEMWPGMYLYSKPQVFTDAACTKPYTGSYTDETAAPTTAGTALTDENRVVKMTFNQMSNGQTLYVKYKVQVHDELFNKDTAQAFVEKYGNSDVYYPTDYRGHISNRAKVTSTEDKNGMTKWADIRTYRARMNKWNHPDRDDFANGLIGWQIALYSLEGETFETGYILDELPVNNELVIDSVVARDGNGNEIKGAVTVSDAVDPDTGKAVKKFTLNKVLMDYLKKPGNTDAWISYQTKVTKQTDVEKIYMNSTKLFYDGKPEATAKNDVRYKKPEELKKGSKYEEGRAPTVDFEININPASLDLDDTVESLTLVDKMSDSYDLDVNSVLINGQKPTDKEFVFDNETKTMTFTLSDRKPYKITYEAAMDLVPGTQLTPDNSGNTAQLSANGKIISETTSTLSGVVYESAGSSSSQAGHGILNIIKHKKGSTTDVLSGAEFTLTEMKFAEDSNIASANGAGTTKKSGDDGKISFGDLKRETVYMFVESKAPEGYEVDDTPVFVAFADATSKLPASIMYEGKSYTVTIVSSDKISTDIYVANAEKSTVTPSPTPIVTPDPDPDDPANATPTSTPTATPTSVPADPADPANKPNNKPDNGTGSSAIPATGEEISMTVVAAAILICSAGVVFFMARRSMKKQG